MTESLGRLDVLVLYDSWSMQTLFVQRHLEAIARHSRHRIHFAPATHNRQADFPLELFDAIIIHFVDPYGSIREKAQQAWAARPNLSEDEIYQEFIEPHDNHVKMNQISPKIFEAIALKTGLVLFEGHYSGVVRTREHFICLKKDFSNIDNVLDAIGDADAVQAMADRAFRDIVETGQYGYSRFVSEIDHVLPSRAPRRTNPNVLVYAIVQAGGGDTSWSSTTPHLPLTAPIAHVDALPVIGPPPPPVFPRPVIPYEPLLKGWLRSLWLALPQGIRRPIVWILGAGVNKLLRR